MYYLLPLFNRVNEIIGTQLVLGVEESSPLLFYLDNTKETYPENISEVRQKDVFFFERMGYKIYRDSNNGDY